MHLISCFSPRSTLSLEHSVRSTMAMLFVIADIIHESILDTCNAISTFIGRSGPSNRAQNGASPRSQTASNGNIVEKEQSRLTDNSMKETNQRLPEDEMVGNQEKIELDRP
jgi:hypothetical protein